MGRASHPYPLRPTIFDDGTKFSVFSANATGMELVLFDHDDEPMMNSPILRKIYSDPVMAGTKLIAEPWDAGGLYQVGSFGQDEWKERNGQFRVRPIAITPAER